MSFVSFLLIKTMNQGAFPFYSFKSRVKSPPPTNAHMHPEETPAQIICRALSWKQKMVQRWRFTTHPMAMEVWRHGRLVGVRGAGKGSPRPCHATSNDSPTRASKQAKNEQRWIAGTRWAGCSPDHCFSELQRCSLWCHWNVQSAEFLMWSGQKIKK